MTILDPARASQNVIDVEVDSDVDVDGNVIDVDVDLDVVKTPLTRRRVGGFI